MVTQINKSYVVLSIAIITVMVAIELFYAKSLCSFLEFLFDYLPLFVLLMSYFPTEMTWHHNKTPRGFENML